jgi:outer membrane protein OmpA-like peptidoglycan-associated protein
MKMKQYIATAGAMVGILLLAGCSGTELLGARQVDPVGAEFNQSLYHGYIGLSEAEYSEGDYRDSDIFAMRATEAGTGGVVAPDAIEARSLPDDHVAQLTQARERLVSALNGGAAAKNPMRAADAQVMFDCWMQEQEENWQTDDIANCRDGFYAAMADIEAVEPVAMTKAVSKPKPKSVRFIVYFGTNESALDGDAQGIIAEAKAAAQKLGKPLVKISGNADTVGDKDYNQILSELRAQAVAKVLEAGDTPARAMATEAHGETQPAVLTADEIDEPRNRRVEIILEP